MTILTCGASPTEEPERHPRQLNPREAESRVLKQRRRFLNAPSVLDHVSVGPTCRSQVFEESASLGPPKSYLLKQTARKIAMNSFLFFSSSFSQILCRSDPPIIPAAAQGDKKEGRVSLRADELIPYDSLVNDRGAEEHRGCKGDVCLIRQE